MVKASLMPCQRKTLRSGEPGNVRLPLDTHAFLWWLFAMSGSLGRQAEVAVTTK